MDFPSFHLAEKTEDGWVEYLFRVGNCIRIHMFRPEALPSIFCNRLWITRRQPLLRSESVFSGANRGSTRAHPWNKWYLLLTIPQLSFKIWQPWSLDSLLLIIIWFFVSAAGQPLKHLARTAFLALLPNTEDGVWRWGSTGLEGGRAWNSLSGLIWTGLEWSTVRAICISLWIWVLDLDNKEKRKGRIQVQTLEGCKLRWWKKQRRAVLRNARQKGKIRQLLSPSAGHNRGMVSWKGAGG